MQHLKKYKQFVGVKLVPRDNRIDKVPVNNEGRNIDAHNPVNWLHYDDVTTPLKGFVLTANDPFICVDIDKCYDGAWASHADKLAAMFPGAFWELSQSGQGAHIWFSGDAPDEHRCKFKYEGAQIEVYSQKRFICLGAPMGGDETVNHTVALDALLPKLPVQTLPAPITGTLTLLSDADVILRLISTAPSLNAAFGGGVTPAQLWYGDVEAMGERWPHEDQNIPFNHSHADAALLTHLAFWTGRNAEQMERIFTESFLGKRDKWLQVEGYRKRSIEFAITHCERIYEPKPPSVTVSNGGTGSMIAPGDYETFFKDHCYIESLNKIWVPDGSALKQEVYNGRFGNRRYVTDTEGTKPTLKAWDAYLFNTLFMMPKARKAVFDPGLAPGLLNSDYPICNTYVPHVPIATAGDVTPFLELLTRLLPDPHDQNIVLAFMATCVQKPGKKIRWMIVLQGVEGNGKSTMLQIMHYCMGLKYTHKPKAAKIANQFNGWLNEKLLILIEEIHINNERHELVEAIKDWITDTIIEVEGKSINQDMIQNHANFMATTNYNDAIPKTKNDRRFAVFFTAQQSVDHLWRDGLTEKYFFKLHTWLEGDGYAHVCHWLQHYPIPPEYCPLTTLLRAPVTSTENLVINASHDVFEQHVIEAVEQEAYGFQSGWISLWAVTDYLKRVGYTRVAGRTIALKLKNLGYVSAGRSTKRLPNEGGTKPSLYVTVDHSALAGDDQNKRTIDYIHAQQNPSASVMGAFGVA